MDEDQVIAMILKRGKFTTDGAQALYKSCSGDITKVINEINKFRYLDVVINDKIIEKYVSVSFKDVFVEKLFDDKKIVFSMCVTVGEKQLPLIIGSIEYALCNMLMLIRNRNKQLAIRDLSERTNIPIFLIGKYLYWSKGVSTEVVYKRIKLLANLDVACRKGNMVGSLERFVALW